MTSLHPLSFHRNDFSTCSTHFSSFLAKAPTRCFLCVAHVDFARACARGQRPPLLRTCNITRAWYGRGRVPAAHAQMTSLSCDTEQMALCTRRPDTRFRGDRGGAGSGRPPRAVDINIRTVLREGHFIPMDVLCWT